MPLLCQMLLFVIIDFHSMVCGVVNLFVLIFTLSVIMFTYHRLYVYCFCLNINLFVIITYIIAY